MKLELARIDSVTPGDWVQGYFNPSFHRVTGVQSSEYTELTSEHGCLYLPSDSMILIGRAE